MLVFLLGGHKNRILHYIYAAGVARFATKRDWVVVIESTVLGGIAPPDGNPFQATNRMTRRRRS
jgi:hypothetical protein